MRPWPAAPLGDVCTFLNGGTPSRSVDSYWDGTIPWITGADIDSPRVTRSRSSVTEAGLRASATSRVPAGTLLLVTRTSVGKVATAGIDLCFSQDITAVIPDVSSLDTEYLRHFLAARAGALKSAARGATIQGVSRRDVASLVVPLPPLAEQRRIAAILDAADDLRAKRRATITVLDTLTQSIFIDIFGDPVANPKGWPEELLLGEVAAITSGITVGRKVPSEPLRAVPYLAVSNVQAGRLALSKVKTIDVSEAELDRYRLVEHDVLMTEGGDPDKLGRGTVWGAEVPECIHQNHVFRVRVTDPRVTPIFVTHLTSSSRGRRYFLRSAKQTTGIASINMTQLRHFPLLVPPVELQRAFANAAAGVLARTRAALASQAQLDDLFSSLQARAFGGQL